MEHGGIELKMADNPVSLKLGIFDKKIEPVVNLYRTSKAIEVKV